MHYTHKLITLLSFSLLVSSCELNKDSLFTPATPDMTDPAMHLSRDDYRNITNPDAYKKTGGETTTPQEPPIPELADILVAPHAPKIGETQLVSIAVTDDVPLKDVLVELARLANVDIEVDSGISGGINFRAKDRPFNEVIDRIADMAGLRYSMKGNILRVERDTPYIQIYTLDFLNMERSSTSTVNITTSVLSATASAGGGGGGGGLNNGSNSTVTSKADSDFWKEFGEGVQQILAYKEPRRTSDIQLASQPALPASPPDTSSSSQAPASSAAGGSTTTPATPATPTPAAQPAAAPADSSAPSGDASSTTKIFYSINRQASTMTVSATQRQHELIKEFIKRVSANSSAQVLIEAKIVEVTLNDQYQSGIDWTQLGKSHFNFTAAYGGVSDVKNVGKFTFNDPNPLGGNISLDTVVQLAQTFGTTRTLSSPRLHAINNQQAVLTFAENVVYFSITATQTQTGTTSSGSGTTAFNTLTINSTAHTVPIGIIMSIQPSIDLATNEITLSVRPTLSRITDTVIDPAIAYTLALASAQGVDTTGISSSVPEVAVRELDSILKLKSGQVMVIGGLMENTSNNTDNGVPGVESVPFLGNLFKGVNKQNKTQELVIFIRATIVNPNGDAGQADKDVYHKFTRDPRPLTF